MKRTIQFYEAPRMKVRQLRASRVLCQSGQRGEDGYAGGFGFSNDYSGDEL